MHTTEAAPVGGFFSFGRPVLLVDSITEAIGQAKGCVVVSGSHGGISAGRFAAQAGGFLTVLNDAGVGKDGAGIAGLNYLPKVAWPGARWPTPVHASARQPPPGTTASSRT